MPQYYSQIGEAIGAAMAHNARQAAELHAARAERATPAEPEAQMTNTTPPTDEQRAVIRARAEAATPGPWRQDDAEDVWRLHGTHPRIPGMKWQILKAPKTGTPYAEYWPSLDDAEFITAAREDVPALLAEVDRLRAENAQYEALDLGDPDGRISASCDNSDHPTWLRLLTDTRGCPWCELEESGAQIQRITSQAVGEESRLRADLATARIQVLAEAADHLDQVADATEAKVAEHYGPASGIGPGSADMVREAARSVRSLAGAPDGR